MSLVSMLSLRASVVDAIGEVTGYSPEAIVDTNDIVDDLGVDSMASISLLLAIEDHVGVPLPDGCEGRLVGIRTVGDLVESLAAVYRGADPA
jgi:acyl carrier protein